MAHAENDLIQKLPRADRQRLLALCEPMQLSLSEVLCEIGAATRDVIFPVDSFVSLITEIPGHAGIEVGMVGREGMVGTQLALGIETSPLKAVVQGSGAAWRLGSVHFRRELERSDALRQTLQRYSYVTMTQLSTASACRAFHDIEPRLVRWLLMSHDRAHVDTFHVTHEFLALMLGVRRVGVTVAAGNLQASGLISYHRGEVTVVDRPGLEARACSCYAADRAVYQATMVRWRTDGAASAAHASPTVTLAAAKGLPA